MFMVNLYNLLPLFNNSDRGENSLHYHGKIAQNNNMFN